MSALIAYKRGRRARPLREEVFRQFLGNTRVHKMAAKFEFELNLKGDRDEIVQGMALVFLDKYLDTLDEPANVYTLLYSVARHVALTVRGGLMSHDSRYVSLTEPDTSNHRSLRPVDHEVPLAEPHEVVEVAAEDFAHNVEQAIDRKRAEAKLAERLAQLPPELRARIEEPAPVAEVKVRRVRELSDDARRLLAIRDRMHFDNRKFATALGIDHPLFCAYIYGRTKKVRKDVMAAAEKMYRERGDKEAQAIKRLAGAPMRRVVRGWLELLGEEGSRDGLTALGTVLGVNWHTVRRWHENEFKPPYEKLKELDGVVQRAARSRAHRIGARVPAASAATRRATGRTATGASRRRPPRSPAPTPRNKVGGHRRPSTGQTTAKRRSAPPSASKKVKAMTEATKTPAAPAKKPAPKKAAVKKPAKKAPAKKAAKKVAKKAPAKKK